MKKRRNIINTDTTQVTYPQGTVSYENNDFSTKTYFRRENNASNFIHYYYDGRSENIYYIIVFIKTVTRPCIPASRFSN